VNPFESEANWKRRRAEIASWELPPIKTASHFIQYFVQDWGQQAVGPGLDWEPIEFWTHRAFRRLAQIGVEVAGIYGGFFAVPEGFSRAKAMDQAIRWINLMADCAEEHDMLIALEPTAEPDTLWPMYLDGIKFAKERVGRASVRVMADLNYFVKGDQHLEHIASEPDYCLNVHIAGDGGQPGIGDCIDLHTRLFPVLRDIGYERGVAAACPWVSSDGGELDFRKETARALRYLQELREEVYSESRCS
jgi:sugar phosphate isomerase/epimerase